MYGITREELQALMKETGKPAVSIYMPTHRVGREMQQDPTRLKNLVDQVSEQLKQRGMNAEQVNRFLEPVLNLFHSRSFWQHLSNGLAVLLSEDIYHTFRVPPRFDEYARVSDHFYLKPLLPLLTGDGYYYILTLSQDRVRLLEGTRDTVGEVDLENVPVSLQEALKWDDSEKQLQWHTGTAPAPGGGERPAMYHGHGAGEKGKKTNILRFFHIVDAGIQDYLKDREAPLVLAGVEYLLPIYREANTYPRLAEGGIEGNPERMSMEEIHELSWDLVQPFFERPREEAASAYKTLAGRGEKEASSSIEEIAPAAQQGCVDTLFVNIDMAEWGRYDPESGAVERLKPDDPGARDLLDFAAAHTLLNDGVVYAVPAARMPEAGSAAAIFRY